MKTSPKLVLAVIGIVCAVASMFTPIPLAVGVVFIGVACLL